MEVLREAANTPHRLHAIVRLIPKLRNPRREDIINLVQPPKLISQNKQARVNQNIATGLLRIAINLDLLEINELEQVYSLHESLEKHKTRIDDIEEFRLIMLERLSDPLNEHNQRFRRVTAWYTVENERIFSYPTKSILAQQYATTINERDFSDEQFGFNETQYNGWLQWAEFLGWGWKMSLGFDRLIPNCAERLKPLLPGLLPNMNEEMPMVEFMKHLAISCVELDGGIEYERCWSESRPSDMRSNQLSLMLSSGLMTLQKSGVIGLIAYDDSPDPWRLHPRQGSPNIVTHIKRIQGPEI